MRYMDDLEQHSDKENCIYLKDIMFALFLITEIKWYLLSSIFCILLIDFKIFPHVSFCLVAGDLSVSLRWQNYSMFYHSSTILSSDIGIADCQMQKQERKCFKLQHCFCGEINSNKFWWVFIVSLVWIYRTKCIARWFKVQFWAKFHRWPNLYLWTLNWYVMICSLLKPVFTCCKMPAKHFNLTITFQDDKIVLFIFVDIWRIRLCTVLHHSMMTF